MIVSETAFLAFEQDRDIVINVMDGDESTVDRRDIIEKTYAFVKVQYI